jgi:MSHA type pilus biogenesis protein MshL
MDRITINKIFLLLYGSLALTLSSCSSPDIKREVQIPKEAREIKPDRPPLLEPKVPDFVPVTEDVSPLKTRIIDIAARNTPLRDALYVIAESTGLNLLMERSVDPNSPITLTLKNVSAEDALAIIFSSVDYFYSIKDNMLMVRAVDTRAFELGHPAVIQSYNVDVGGDILGGATSGTTGTTSTTNIKGSVTQSAKSDATAFNFWDGIEKGIASILGTTTAAQPAAATTQAAPAAASQVPAPQQSYIVNRITGTIIVTATRRNMERVEQYLSTIRKVIGRQVLVEAKIIEVQLNDGYRFGINWGFLDNLRSVGAINIGKGVGDITSATRDLTGISNTTTSALQLATQFSQGNVFNIGTTAVNFQAILTALQQQGEVRTLSNPRVNIMNGQTALLSVGRNVSFISKVESTTSTGTTPTTTFTVTTSSVLSGIMIGIVPYINENGEISMTVTPIISNLVQLVDRTVGTTQLSLPTVDLRELSTTVKVRDGQMIVIGGLIKKDESIQKDKVPGVGDVPVVGELFSSHNKAESRSELVVVLQPVVVGR